MFAFLKSLFSKSFKPKNGVTDPHNPNQHYVIAHAWHHDLIAQIVKDAFTQGKVSRETVKTLDDLCCLNIPNEIHQHLYVNEFRYFSFNFNDNDGVRLFGSLGFDRNYELVSRMMYFPKYRREVLRNGVWQLGQ